ncbi:DUF86 domain-containing protein [Candidatus Parvarchaeota archaeon]|jgi:uncharacterized protein YutE (UPF0331/DUF86 family)|nr:DUF86 domain-containing protein [Candidatus Parvarchaeota archaeon]
MNNETIKDRILEKSLDLERFSKELVQVLPKTQEEYKKSNILVKSTVERRLQLISDTEIDILAILYKELNLKVVGEDLSLIAAFSEIFKDNVNEKIRRLRDIRNKLIHEYKSDQFDEEVFKIANENLDESDIISGIKHSMA